MSGLPEPIQLTFESESEAASEVEDEIELHTEDDEIEDSDSDDSIIDLSAEEGCFDCSNPKAKEGSAKLTCKKCRLWWHVTCLPSDVLFECPCVAKPKCMSDLKRPRLTGYDKWSR